MRFKITVLISLIFFSHISFAEQKKELRWKIQSQSWSTRHEQLYQEFIHQLGVARKKGYCKTTNDCLKHPFANPQYFNQNPSGLLNIFSDCADLPFILRAYFSWMNNLPFSYPTDLVEAKSLSRRGKDIRYSKYGNIVRSKHNITSGENINNVLQTISDTISTASFRTNASLNDSGNLFRDTYPVDIDRSAIVPGTVLYDPNGHVAVVYEVTSNGKILLMDAHPDNSITVITYGEKFARTGIKIGGGFSNFRPFTMNGNKVSAVRNSEISNYSLIQFQTGPFIFKGKTMTFHEYVRNKLADGDIIYNPIAEFRELLDELCQDLKNREEAVNSAIKSNLHNMMHPFVLPENIYGTDGDWEAYASPARDSRIKTSVKQMKEFLQKMISAYKTHELIIEYSGDDLVRDLREIYFSKSGSCKVKPASSLQLNLDSVLINLFALSFDPYHCAELRWGIVDSASCSTSRNKMKWYLAEQGLRNRIDRDTTLKTDYDVDTLPSAPASRVEKPNFSFDQLLEIKR